MPFQWLWTMPSFAPSAERDERPAGCTSQESLPEGDLQNDPSGAGQEAQCAAVKYGRSRVSLE